MGIYLFRRGLSIEGLPISRGLINFREVKRVFLAVLILSGCAYSVGYRDRVIPGGYTTIAIPNFKNRTGDVGMEVYFTNALRSEFSRSQVGRLVDEGQAPAILQGSIDKIEYLRTGTLVQGKNTAGTNQVNSLEDTLPKKSVLSTGYRIVATVTLKLVRGSDEKVLWTREMEEEKSYDAPQIGVNNINSANPLYNSSARHKYIKLLAEDMMSDAHDRLTEQF